MLYTYNTSSNPLTAELCLIGKGGLGLLEVWVKDASDATFTLYASYTGEDGTWREIDVLSLPYKGKDNRHTGYLNAYPYVKVVNTSETLSEIELLAGES